MFVQPSVLILRIYKSFSNQMQIITKPLVSFTCQPKAYLLRDITYYLEDFHLPDFIGPLHKIFCGGHRLLDGDLYNYAIGTTDEFLDIFSRLMNNISSADRSDLENHLTHYIEKGQLLYDESIFTAIFRILQKRNISFEYGHQKHGKTNASLQKADRLVNMLITYKDNHAVPEGKIDEYVELEKLDLPEIQKCIQEQLLFSAISDLAPCKVLTAYFSTHLQLPETTSN